MTDLVSLAQRLLEAARTAGAEAADALVTTGESLNVEARAGAAELVERSEGLDFGLRVLVGQRQATVSASDPRPEVIAEMAARAVAMAREAPEDSALGLADPAQLSARRDAGGLDLLDTVPDPDVASLTERALASEAAALEHKGISQVQSASAGWSRSEVVLVASNGFLGSYSRGSHYLSCVAISGEGLAMERDYFGESRVHLADLPDAAEVGRLAAERALARQGPRKPRTGRYPVLFDERIAASLVGHLTAAINGTAIVRGASWLRDALGTPVLPAGMSLTEDPLRPRASASRPFDAEGLAVAARDIVAGGVLTGWVLDLGTARRLGLASTGNASRGTGSPPSPGLSNLALTQGSASRDELIAQMGTGLLVTGLIGSAINPTTGDYSRGASGFWVEGGEIAYPVNEITIAGNLREMLLSPVPANDARAHSSRVVPSLLVEGLTLAGA